MEIDFHKFFMISEFKGVEIDVRKLGKMRSYFDLSLSLTTNNDHAGYHSYLSLFGFSLEFNIYDIRHWDHILNCWESLPEPKEEGDEWEDQIGI